MEARAEEIVRLGTGRPTTYTPEQGDQICEWLSAGRSLASWCRRENVRMQVVYQWLGRQAAFAERYRLACEARADTLADELIDIADAPTEDGLTMEEVQLRRLRIDTRKWIAAKLVPKRWGDQQQVATAGAVTINIGIPSAQPELVVQADDGTAVYVSP